MTHAGIILVLVVALFLGVIASIHAASAETAPILTSRDQSTGPFNPNSSREDSRPRGVGWRNGGTAIRTKHKARTAWSTLWLPLVPVFALVVGAVIVWFVSVSA